MSISPHTFIPFFLLSVLAVSPMSADDSAVSLRLPTSSISILSSENLEASQLLSQFSAEKELRFRTSSFQNVLDFEYILENREPFIISQSNISTDFLGINQQLLSESHQCFSQQVATIERGDNRPLFVPDKAPVSWDSPMNTADLVTDEVNDRDFEYAFEPFDQTACCPSSSNVAVESICLGERIVMLTYLNGSMGRGLGFDCDYSTLGIYISKDSFTCFSPYADLRWHCFADRKIAANIGFGVRYYSPENCREHGISFYYDYREGCLCHYNQIGVGIESLGPCVDFRIHAYYPLRKEKCVCEQKTVYEGGFFAKCWISEYTFKGLDADVGFTLFCRPCFNVYFDLGPYYFSNDLEERAIGGKVRLTLNLFTYVGIDFCATFDSVFNNRLQTRLYVGFPLYSSRGKSASCCDKVCYPKVHYPYYYRNDMIILNDRVCWDFNFHTSDQKVCKCRKKWGG